MSRHDSEVEGARALLRAAGRVMVFTGAGVSAESGIPTFRGDGGLWKRFRPEDLANPDAFRDDPRLVWEWYASRREAIGECAPNPAHRAIARLHATDKEVSLVTQNVDNLHQRAFRDEEVEAGADGVLQLHGSIFHVRCTACPWSDGFEDEVDAGSLESLPRCPECGALARPAVVWFGESLDAAVLEEAASLAESADLCLVVGTSGVVEPAASLPRISAESGAAVIEVNPEPTPLTSLARTAIQAPAGRVLPRLLDGTAG